ncbi:hypothetical protein P153DRAFT_98042 [Dothidotthia symphoricarpi CBS 119687]|uniref:Uncharacterized protein n=1 Tax=Dothidotthia symphoricarpi CBS 119687 TaxID=1392245 RepID=A0A6A6APM9_9PLEO|nr:uncharacterized protein P153DRAFT_98042 [Dothidotthia symphoricarpi CBS 119687]KAF2133750.1 hypothetical protein P153DRAFT_98042 [Dothidotthia symphoricarpi CBS 119687]
MWCAWSGCIRIVCTMGMAWRGMDWCLHFRGYILRFLLLPRLMHRAIFFVVAFFVSCTLFLPTHSTIHLVRSVSPLY